MPTMPERQATKLPDAGATITKDDRKRLRRALYAGMTTGSQGALGNPQSAKPTLG